jgi:hypothetical protein
MRRDCGVPEMPFVIGVMRMGGATAGGELVVFG